MEVSLPLGVYVGLQPPKMVILGADFLQTGKHLRIPNYLILVPVDS